MTTINIAPERYVFGGIDLSSLGYLPRAITGADDLPQLRGENAAYTGIAGRRPLGKLPDEKVFTIGLWVTPDESSLAPEATNAAKTRANLDALLAVLADRATGTLERYMPDGSLWTADAEVVAIGQFEDPASGELIGLAVDFLLADPWWYGPTTLVPTDAPAAIAASPTTVPLTNPGTVKTHRLTLDFVGPISNPRVTNEANGEYVECLVTVADGTHLLIDCEAFTATNDSVNAIGSIRHSGAYPFLELVPGDQDLTVTCTTAGGTLRVSYRPPYL